MKFRPKRGLYVKRPTLLILGFAWLFLFWVGVVLSFTLWLGIVGILVTFVSADFLYDQLMHKLNQNSRRGIFAVYFPVVVVASIFSDWVAFETKSGVGIYFLLFPTSIDIPIILATAIVSFVVVLMIWGEAGMIQADRKRGP